MSVVSTASEPSDTDTSSSTSHYPLPGHISAVGLSNAQDQSGQKRRHALDLVHRLQNTGVQTDIDLPQIAVIGNQSAGKSSLIEAISGITLPRASGTCTRCPTECRLTNDPAPDAAWKCVITIRTITDRSGQALGQPLNEPFGEVIYDKAQVEDRLRRAQRAILNPHISRSQILLGDDELNDGRALTFSSNYVSMQISGPGVADLSFCDLPGLVRSTKEGSTDDIALVEGLVESYIKKPSCIILLTVSCETDIENQGALHLARKYDPKGLRTVGVLTKPDRIAQGDEDDWVRFIKNEGDHKLLNNWFCVRQPNSTELREGITWEEARNKENQFFTTHAHWRELDPMYQRYLRTQNLVGRLSSILSDLISKRLPEIYNELQLLIQKTHEDLSKLPKEPSQDPFSDISAMIHGFIVDLSKLLEGTPEHDALLQCIRPHQEKFKREIRRSAPKFRPYEKESGPQTTMPRFEFLDNEENEQEGDDDEDNLSANRQPIYIEEVYRRLQDARTRELPDKYPYIIEEWFIQQITQQWSAPSQELCLFVHKTTLEHILRLVRLRFAEFGQGVLERQARLIIEQHMKDRLEATKDRIKWLLDLEYRPFTMNTHYLSDYKNKFLSHYKMCRLEQGPNQRVHSALQSLQLQDVSRYSNSDGPEDILRQILTALGRLGITADSTDLVKLLPEDEMKPALDIMAEVRAYFQVAYKRFTDNVPLAIDYEMVKGFERDFYQYLTSKLGIHGPNSSAICRELAQESTQVATRREELLKKLERMKAGSDELSRIV
ncbi:P-loop containing nucleoside triphosphate hydrolase protein [Lentinula raphanica]|uniref:P-loop containing nucleoside triphosphate hydrolase protein n=1 Tax=Lentinula raphanica TaxID=153919 RepID=A0AA38UKE1_9AGAR|nr:P-loop containing nucleoside triphosphate hydrolase protein [Lentinula raphanica]KAJ3844992.1 P-loop containing nucleoside triphosphate hydrolase protein [Lentinula raphanica]KAJ3973587.1 P-loop containing nucleoside triphosphate hydrolase protein [Lentinula raphanica]